MASHLDPVTNLFATLTRITALEAENTSLRQELAAAQQKPEELRGHLVALQNTFAGMEHDLGVQGRIIKELTGELEKLMKELGKDSVPQETTGPTHQGITNDRQSAKTARRKRHRDRRRNRKNENKRNGEDTPAVKAEGTGESSTDLAHRAEDAGPSRKKAKMHHATSLKIKRERPIIDD
ncbi:hypothetical protein IQ07DRAFT_632098 [Pyrenochaeta sp. DS3sAY3a]|nr:hypothetical protein IQ07DRAFT_632098 [Pyrenochaeta sp. DS3sAY3a]